MRRAFWVTVALAAFVLTAAGTHAGIILDPALMPQHVDYANNDPKFEASGWLGVWLDDGSHVYCSLTAIDEYWAVTAGHCLFGLDGEGGGVTEMVARWGPNGLDDYDLELEIVEWYMFPGYGPDVPWGDGYDVGLVKFAEPIPGITPAERYRGDYWRGMILSGAGYGTPGDAINGPYPYDGGKLAGDDDFWSFGGDPGYSEYEPQYSMGLFGILGIQPLEWHGYYGDSGTGMFGEFEGEWLLTNVETFMHGDWQPGSSTGALRLDGPVNPWIDGIIAAGGVPGDMDNDGDVDNDDFALFAPCLLGPEVPVSGGCEEADLDADTDCDLADFAAFQQVFTGPGRGGRDSDGKPKYPDYHPSKQRRSWYYEP